MDIWGERLKWAKDAFKVTAEAEKSVQESRSTGGGRRWTEARLGRACSEAKPPAFLLHERGARH